MLVTAYALISLVGNPLGLYPVWPSMTSCESIAQVTRANGKATMTCRPIMAPAQSVGSHDVKSGYMGIDVSTGEPVSQKPFFGDIGSCSQYTQAMHSATKGNFQCRQVFLPKDFQV